MTEKMTLAERINKRIAETPSYNVTARDFVGWVLKEVEAEEAQRKELAKRFQSQLPSTMFSRYGYPSEWDTRLWAVYFKPFEWRKLISQLEGSKAESE